MAIAESASISSEIMRDDFGPQVGERREVQGLHHPAFFPDPPDDQKAALIDDGTKAFEHVGHDDEVRKAGLVFEGDKDNVIRGHRTLADYYRTGDRCDV